MRPSRALCAGAGAPTTLAVTQGRHGHARAQLEGLQQAFQPCDRPRYSLGSSRGLRAPRGPRWSRARHSRRNWATPCVAPGGCGASHARLVRLAPGQRGCWVVFR